MTGELTPVTVRVNGAEQRLVVEPRRLLADLLREDLGLRSVHLGCEHGSCGSCMVLLDGAPVTSCLQLAGQVDGREVLTLEGLLDRDDMRALQQAFHEQHALQCGYCTPGMLVSLYALRRMTPRAGADEIREWLRGNLCRCTGYLPIVAAAAAQPDGPPEPA